MKTMKCSCFALDIQQHSDSTSFLPNNMNKIRYDVMLVPSKVGVWRPRKSLGERGYIGLMH